MKLIHKNEEGFTLIEIMIALGIFGLVAAAASGTIVQVIQGNRSADHKTALRQVQSAGSATMVSRLSKSLPPPPQGFLLPSPGPIGMTTMPTK